MTTHNSLVPNTTQVPNVILDHLDQFNDTELRVLLVITRQTLGWHKDRDWLSIKQIMDKTGKGRTRVGQAISSLVEKGILSVVLSDGTLLKTPTQRQEAGRRHRRFYFTLNTEQDNKGENDEEENETEGEEEEGLVQKMNKACSENEQGLVQNLNTTKETHIQKPLSTKTGSSEDFANAQSSSEHLSSFPALTVQAKATALRERHDKLSRKEIVGYVTDLLLGMPDAPKPNARKFVEAAGGMKPLYKFIAYVITQFPLDFLVDWLPSLKAVPWKPGVDWKKYLFGAALREYRLWWPEKEKQQAQMEAKDEPSLAEIVGEDAFQEVLERMTG